MKAHILLDNRSFALNDELNLIVYDRAFAGRLEAVFADDRAHSTAVGYAEWRRRGLGERVLEWLAVPLHAHL